MARKERQDNKDNKRKPINERQDKRDKKRRQGKADK